MDRIHKAFKFLFTIGVMVTCQQTLVALGQAKISLVLALLRKIILLIPLVFILPCFMSNQVFAVYLAEPVADIAAAAITGIVFFVQFPKILKKQEQKLEIELQ